MYVIYHNCNRPMKKACVNMNSNQLYCYKKMPEWDAHNFPSEFQKKHNTREGVWAKLNILQGQLEFAYLTEAGETVATHTFSENHQPPFIEPQRWHKVVSFSDDIRCQLGFYCAAEDYCVNKHGFTKTHSEVIKAAQFIAPGRALDLGCGAGRNALYLNLLGFDVTAYEKNSRNVAGLKKIIQEEQLSQLRAEEYDINTAAIDQQYDWILSTVVFMFLMPERIPDIIKNMQEHTAPDGYNLIVSAMETEAFSVPESLPFTFLFKPDELKSYYQNWDILEYNENPGELHRVDEQGNRIRMRFATLLARKNASNL